MILLLLAALSLPQPTQVDRIEVNTYPCGSGKQTQIILWRWTRLPSGYGYRVSDWWLCDSDTQAVKENGSYVLRDHVDGKLIELKTNSYEVTQTDEDPELRDRDSLPQDLRRSHIR